MQGGTIRLMIQLKTDGHNYPLRYRFASPRCRPKRPQRNALQSRCVQIRLSTGLVNFRIDGSTTGVHLGCHQNGAFFPGRHSRRGILDGRVNDGRISRVDSCMSIGEEASHKQPCRRHGFAKHHVLSPVARAESKRHTESIETFVQTRGITQLPCHSIDLQQPENEAGSVYVLPEMNPALFHCFRMSICALVVRRRE